LDGTLYQTTTAGGEEPKSTITGADDMALRHRERYQAKSATVAPFQWSAAALKWMAGDFPAVFALERWQPHRPPKIGINDDIAATGIMPAEDIESAHRA
jgi:hypothetical protein